MNGFYQVCVPCERLEGVGIVALQPVTHIGLVGIKIGALQPSQLTLRVAPTRSIGLSSGP
jgi:hypothetical protein